jgi:hypothetical protein
MCCKAFCRYCLPIIGIIMIVSCSTKKITVKKTPKTKIVYNYQDKLLLNGNPRLKKPWIIYADKDNVSVYSNKKYINSDKKVDFGTPFIVLKKNGDLYKVARYEPKSIINNKIEKKKAKPYGWIHKNDLLLWDESLRNEANGFRIKSVLSINNKKVIKNSENFFSNDSVILYKEPALLTESDIKLPIGDIVYLYKLNDGNTKALIGSNPIKNADDENTKIYGWIDTQILSLWNQRTSFKINSPRVRDNNSQVFDNRQDTISKHSSFLNYSFNNTPKKNGIENLFALEYSKKDNDFLINYFDNVSDYSDNRAYNVLGGEILFNDYKNIVENSKHLNIAFLIDASPDNVSLLSNLKSVIQELNLNLINLDYFNEITYSALFYNIDKKKSNENVLLSHNYNDLIKILGKEFPYNKNQSNSLYESTRELNNMLTPRAEETNLVIIVGNKLEDRDKINQNSLISDLASINSKIVFFQLKSDNSDNYNDFVLFGETALKKTTNSSSQNKKRKLINQDHVIDWIEFDLSRGDQGIYRLDYPNNSMTPGAIVFPKKGEISRSLLLQNILNQIIDEVIADNTMINNALIAFFRSSIGVSQTKIKKEYKDSYDLNESYIPVDLAIQLLDKDYAFMLKGKINELDDYPINIEEIEYGVLLDEEELEQVKNFYNSVYSNIFKNKNLINRRMIRHYITTAKRRSVLHKKLKRSTLRKNTIGLGLFLNTGLYSIQTDSISSLKLNKWKRRKTINPIVLEDYFRSFKTIADNISDNKGKKDVLINHNGVKYYWLNNNYLPHLNFNIKKDSIKKDNDKYLDQKGDKNKYIDRVKKGLL